MRRRSAIIAVLSLAIVGGASYFTYQRTGPAPIRPESTEGLDPLVQELLEEEIARAGRSRRSAAAWLRLGMVYEANALHGEATRCYEQALVIRPGHAQTLHRLANTQERLGDLEMAVETMAKAADADPSHPASWWQLAWWCIDLGQLDTAERALERARALSPADPAVPFTTVRLLLAIRKPEDAVAVIEQKQLLGGTEAPYAYHLLSLARRQLGDLDGAVAAQAKSDGKRVQFSDPWRVEMRAFQTGYASLRLQAGRDILARRFADAEQRLKEIVANDPEDLGSLNNLATCLLERGDVAGALELLRQVLALEPEHYGGTINLARGLLRQEVPNPDALGAAYDRLRRAMDTRPEDGDGWRVLAAVAEAVGRPVEMIEALDRAIAINPTATPLRLKAAYTALTVRQFAEALVRFQAIQREVPAETEAWFGEVMVHLYAERAGEARSALERLSRRADADSARLSKLRTAVAAMR